jgi:hypothetical protein
MAVRDIADLDWEVLPSAQVKAVSLAMDAVTTTI